MAIPINEGIIAAYISITFTAISGCVIALRCITRFLIVRKARVEDFIAIWSYVSSFTFTWLICQQAAHGLGRSLHDLSPLDQRTVFKNFWGSVITYFVCITLVKISALTQYLGFLFERKVRIVCWTTAGAVVAFGVVGVCISIFMCHPVAFAWDKTIPGGKCMQNLDWWYFATGFVVLTDIIVVIIPFATLKGLTMAPNHKRALIIVFALGGLGCVTAIPRLHALYVAATSHDMTKDNAGILWWCSVELNIGVICISLPPLKALVRFVSPYLRVKNSSRAQSDDFASGSTAVDLESAPNIITVCSSKNQGPDPWVIP